jgi:hypothetical protein
MELREIILKRVSFQSNAWSPIEDEKSIEEIIKDIKTGKYAEEVKKLRIFLFNNEKDKYDIYKKRLPGVTFSACFEKARKKELIKHYNRIIVIDIDKLDEDELERTKEILKNDAFVFTFWISPSEKGIKGLIYLEYLFEIEKYRIDLAHSTAFQQITRYFNEKYSIKLDISGSDTTRLCFLSYDPYLIFKTEISPFPIIEPEITKSNAKIENGPKTEQIKTQYISSEDILKNPKGKNNQKDKKILVNIIKFLKRHNYSITTTYEDWYRVAYAIANSFTHDIGERYYLSLCELDGEKHDAIQSKNMLYYCYQNNKGSISFSTIIYLAKDKGFKI